MSLMRVSEAEIGPHSPRFRLRRLDRRTRAGRFLIATEQALVGHLGGPERVSVPQRILIERVASDLLRLELLEEKLVAKSFTDHDARIAHALRNSIRLALRDLGFEKEAHLPAPSLEAYLAKKVPPE